MRINDVVFVNQDVEISPLNFVRKATIGKIIDETIPNYACVRFADGNYAWMDKKYLTVIKTGY